MEEENEVLMVIFRKAVISLAVMDEAEVEKEVEEVQENMKETERTKEEEDVGSPFELMDTVYV